MILDTYIHDIPCQVRVTHYTPGEPPIISGPMGGADPGCPAEIEFDVLDDLGRPDPRLESQMTDADTRAVEQQIIDAHESDVAEAKAESQIEARAFREWGAYV